VLGVSLGVFAAATVAGWLSVEAAFTAVMAQAQAIEQHCDHGGLIAVVGDTGILARLGVGERCEIALVNSASHFVLAAPHDQLDAIERELRASGVAYQRLAVRYAFHSKWIDAAQPTSVRASASLTMPFVCCVGACVLDRLPPDYFWIAARQPVRFGDTIAMLERQGGACYVDVGPSSALATCLTHILPAISRPFVRSILSPFGHDLQRLEVTR
jgi:bacillaene synthase trans-acting acyltransferase